MSVGANSCRARRRDSRQIDDRLDRLALRELPRAAATEEQAGAVQVVVQQRVPTEQEISPAPVMHRINESDKLV